MITLRENKDLQENQEAKEGRVHRYDNVSTVCVDELLPLATKRRYLCCRRIPASYLSCVLCCDCGPFLSIVFAFFSLTAIHIMSDFPHNFAFSWTICRSRPLISSFVF